MSSDHEAQKDEMLALESIFDTSEFQKYENQKEYGGQFNAFVSIPDDFKIVYRDLRVRKTNNGFDFADEDDKISEVKLKFLPPLELSFTLPWNYPSAASPSFTLTCHWLDRSQLTKLCDKLDSLWAENEGLEILYLWMSFLKEDSYNFLNLGPSLDLSKHYTLNLYHIERMKLRLETEPKVKVLSEALNQGKNADHADKIIEEESNGKKLASASAGSSSETTAGTSGLSLKASGSVQTSTTEKLDVEVTQRRGVWGRGKSRGRGRGRPIIGTNAGENRKMGTNRGQNSMCDSVRDNHPKNGSSKDGSVKYPLQTDGSSGADTDSVTNSRRENKSLPPKASDFEEPLVSREEKRFNTGSPENDETGFTQPSESTTNIGETMRNVKEEQVMYAENIDIQDIPNYDNVNVKRTNSKRRTSLSQMQEDKLDVRAVSVMASRGMFIDFLKEYDGNCSLKEFERNIFTCRICFDDKPGKQCVKFFGCGHVFCRECVSGYFSVQITDGNVQSMTCLEESCKSEALQTQVRDLVTPELFAKYDALLLASTLDMMDDIVYCPRKTCQYPVSRDGEETMARCPQCRYTFCIACKMTYHGVEPCRLKLEDKRGLIAEYEGASEEKKAQLEFRYGRKQLQDLVNLSKTESWISDNSKNCPHCQAAIEKSDGCNKMTCWKCNTFFCWICSERLDERFPYLHFNSPTSKCFNLLFHGTPDEEDEMEIFEGEDGGNGEDDEADHQFFFHVEDPVLAL